MPGNDLFDIVADVNSSNVQRSILPHKTTDTTHIIAIIRMLVSTEGIDIGVEEIVNRR